MITPTPEYIAATRTCADWRQLRARLGIGGTPDLWRLAYKDFFLARLDLRYLHPIRLLQEHGTLQGEGFSIVAIQCSLLEFLESTFQGLSYRYIPRGATLGPFEYSSSSAIVKNFLVSRAPFSREFTPALAEDFYVSVRCGLLHEARTRNGWRVWAKSPVGTVLSIKDKAVYRDDFQCALLDFIADYGKQLPADLMAQQAFLRKFDSLCNGAA